MLPGNTLGKGIPGIPYPQIGRHSQQKYPLIWNQKYQAFLPPLFSGIPGISQKYQAFYTSKSYHARHAIFDHSFGTDLQECRWNPSPYSPNSRIRNPITSPAWCSVRSRMLTCAPRSRRCQLRSWPAVFTYIKLKNTVPDWRMCLSK